MDEGDEDDDAARETEENKKRDPLRKKLYGARPEQKTFIFVTPKLSSTYSMRLINFAK